MYNSLNGTKSEMDKSIFTKLIKNIDSDITEHELDILYGILDTDNSGLISY